MQLRTGFRFRDWTRRTAFAAVLAGTVLAGADTPTDKVAPPPATDAAAQASGTTGNPYVVACWDVNGDPDAGPKMEAWAGAANQQLSSPFRLPAGDTWSGTATDGFGLVEGDPITLTWGFVADGTTITAQYPGEGEVTSASNLIAFLDGIYGAGPGGADLTLRPWFPVFQAIFSAWSDEIGIRYVYEPNDTPEALPTFQGSLGVRPDVRIGGHTIDGQSGSNILAYNFYPDNGDMVIDTSNTTFYGNTANSSRALRNVLAHEHGHGLGLRHVCPVNGTKLMEPFVNLGFDGTQEDDVLGGNRGYGDRFEWPNGNESAADPTNFHTEFPGTSPLAFGAPLTIDTVSVDRSGDTDFYRVDLQAASLLDVTLTPTGTTYLEGPQNGDGSCTPGTNFNALNQNNLALQVRASDGTTVLASADLTGAGGSETISSLPVPAGGTVYVRVTGSINAAQMYDLTVSAAAGSCVPPPAPTPAAAFLRPRIVRIAGSVLRLNGYIDVGTTAPDWESATTVTIGSEVINIGGGLTPNRRRTSYSWRSADRTQRLWVKPARRGSRASYGFYDSATAAPATGALALGFSNADFSTSANVGMVSGNYRQGVELASAPPFTLSRMIGYLAGGGDDWGTFNAEFAGDGMVPATAPDLVLRVGAWEVCVPDAFHVVTSNSRGYRYAIPDPDGTGPLLAQGAWFVDVDFVRQRVRAFFRGVDLGTYAANADVPIVVSFGVDGVEHAVEVLAVNNLAGDRLLYR